VFIRFVVGGDEEDHRHPGKVLYEDRFQVVVEEWKSL